MIVRAVVFLAIVVSLCPMGYGWEGCLSQYELFETALPDIPLAENPYDPDSIRVDAHFHREQGPVIVVPCFYDGEAGWTVRFTPREAGVYACTTVIQTVTETVKKALGTIQVLPREAPGFIRIGRHTGRFFVFENGEPYFPVGQNMGWQGWNDPNALPMWERSLEKCAAVGMNWIRIWMCPWGLTELEWMPQTIGGETWYDGLGKYEMKSAHRIDAIFQKAESLGIAIQWCILSFNAYNKTLYSTWDQNPLNEANGGFLKEPWDFFTHPQAKKHYKDRLRYLVARWGYSTHLLAWEFWNEVDGTDRFDAKSSQEWHEEMAAYVKAIDPYQHLTTTSVAGQHEAIFPIAGMDYLQSHRYTTHLIRDAHALSQAAALGFPDKPHFIGEMAYAADGPPKQDREGITLHNQLWASVHSADAGTAMTWWWDNWVDPMNLYPIFAPVARYVEGIDWDRENLVCLPAKVEPQAANRGDFIFSPGIEWGHTSERDFYITDESAVKNLNRGTQFIHGKNHRDMAPHPVFHLENAFATEFGVQLANIAADGASLRVLLDGELVRELHFEAGKTDYLDSDKRIVVALPPGKHQIELQNAGTDWVQVGYYWVNGYAQRPQVFARGNEKRVLVWLHDRDHDFPTRVLFEAAPDLAASRICLPSIKEGTFRVEQYDTYSGAVLELGIVSADGEGLFFTTPAFSRDLAFRLIRLEEGRDEK